MFPIDTVGDYGRYKYTYATPRFNERIALEKV